MKKLRISLVLCMAFVINAQAQLLIQKPTQPAHVSIVEAEIFIAFSQTMIKNLDSLKPIALDKNWEKEDNVLLTALPQPKVKYLAAPQPFVIHASEYPIWQKINRRINPEDIPVWRAVSVKKNL